MTTRLLLRFGGVVLFPAVWIILSTVVHVPERYLPSPWSVLDAAATIRPSILQHTLATTARLGIGTLIGTVAGVAGGLAIWRFAGARELLLPTILTLRAIPAIAIVPFFLLWFGFSDLGKVVLVGTTLGFNLAVATHQALLNIDEKFRIAFRSFGMEPRQLPFSFGLPYAMPLIFPTLRYSIAVALGAVIVAELLGSQVGLGYLIQTSRSTFSMNAVLLAMFVLGVLTVVLDAGLKAVWARLIPWKEINDANQN